MLPDYLSYWGFQRHPFSLSPDPDMLFLSTQHREALMRLKYGVMSNKGGVLLISENAGDGKTSILRRLVTDLTDEYEGRVRIAFIDHPTLTVNQMIAEIARQLGVAKVRKEKIDNLNALRVKLLEMHEAGMRPLVIVDEGQMLVHKPDMLQELRILLNFCVSDAFLLSFIFSGQKPLEGALRKMPEFWQRLPVRFFLRNLDLRDTGDLVRFRVRAAGVTEREIFSPTAVEGIFRFSQGCPRVICSIADLSLLVGHSLRSQKIDFGEVSQATTDMAKSGELFHYYSFMESTKSGARRRSCAACGKFLKAKDTTCPHCGIAAGPGETKAREEEKVQCPSCMQMGGSAARCAFCGFLLAQACPRCQHRNPVDSAGCYHCGYPLPGRDVLATRELEQGLQSLGISAPTPSRLERRFLVLKDEGRVLLAAVAPRFFGSGERSSIQSGAEQMEGSFFLTDRSLVFVNGKEGRRIPYQEIRNVQVTIGESERAGLVHPRLSLVVAESEVRITFPVRTDKPVQLASLLSDYLVNKRSIV